MERKRMNCEIKYERKTHTVYHKIFVNNREYLKRMGVKLSILYFAKKKRKAVSVFPKSYKRV